MSSSFSVDARRRWGVRSMILKRWLTQRIFDPAAPLCEIETDGVTEVLLGQNPRCGPNEWGYIYYAYVAEGSEIDPSGAIFEFSDTTAGNLKGQGPIPLHARAKLKLIRRDRYPKIFINYRREDADAYAGRLHEVLVREFGEDEVFMAEFSIRAGEVWDWTIQQAVAHAEVVLVLVGRRWLIAEESGKRRIDSANDVVRREIIAGMDRGAVVMPVLLPEATIPRDREFEWNDPLRLLPQLQFHRFAGVRHWKADVDALVATIKRHLHEQ